MSKVITEAALSTDLSRLVHDLVRELSMACRKTSIYGFDHPMARKAIERSFFVLDHIFRFKEDVNLHLREGVLYVLNIRLKHSLVVEEIVRYLQALDVEAVLFNRQVSAEEFSLFVSRLSTRADQSDRTGWLCGFLEQQRITSVEVNSERAFQYFETHKKFRGDVYGDYSVRNLALQQIGDDLDTLVDIECNGQQALNERSIDFTLEIVRYLLPEKFAAQPQTEVTEKLIDLVRQVDRSPDADEQKQPVVARYQALSRLVDYHPLRDEILARVARFLSESGLPSGTGAQLSTSVSAIRVETSELVDGLLQQFFDPHARDVDADTFCQAFRRLLKTGQRGKATEILLYLFDRLAAVDSGTRETALQLLVVSIPALDLVTDTEVFEAAVGRVETDLAQRRETFEYSEVIRSLLEKCLEKRRFHTMAGLTADMARRRQTDGSVTVYDSMAVKKAFEYLNRQDTVERLVDHMIRSERDISNCVQDILVATCSEEVAVALSHIISHPIRQIRQQSLRVLAELGKASLKVFSQIVVDDAMFEREDGRHELPDGKWYVVRNSIFVLGLLGDPEAVVPLRLRMHDSDVRVRREIISALEKIGGEDACDVLILMGDDAVKEIQQRAVAALGLVGTPETVPLLVDLARRNPSVAVKVVGALGRLGGEPARSFLTGLLEDDARLTEYASGRVSREELRAAAIRSLGSIGDEASIAAVRNYHERLPATQKILRNSSVTRAIAEVLSRH